jgi:signal transduction histidine kinase
VNEASDKTTRMNATTNKKVGNKRVGSRPKRTIHSIAPAIRVRRGDTLSLSVEHASEFAFQLMDLAVRRISISIAQVDSESINAEIDELLQRLDQNCQLGIPEGNALLRLKWLLHHTHRGSLQVVGNDPDASPRSNAKPWKLALHRMIQAISTDHQFSNALEKANRQSIYQLAYGLSHEINNPLGNIAARAQQLMARASESDRKSLATIVDQSMRAHEMLAEMMRVVQPKPISLSPTNVLSTVEQTVQSLQSECVQKKIHLAGPPSTAALFVALDNWAFSESLAALIRNAIEVCKPGDRIDVLCEGLEHSGQDQAAHPSQFLHSSGIPKAKTGEWIRIAVRDTGPGMSPHAAENAWNLYFSGREHGRGLGISLANVKRIIDAHEGIVWIDSAPGAGCTVEIRLRRISPPMSRRKMHSV